MFGNCVHHIYLLTLWIITIFFVCRPSSEYENFWSRREEGRAQPFRGFLHSSVGKASACNMGDLDSVPELGSSPGEGNGNPLQYYCLENPLDRESYGQRGLACYSSWDRKSQTWLSTIFLSFPKVKSRFVQFPVGFPHFIHVTPMGGGGRGEWSSLLPWTIIYTTNIRVKESSNYWRFERQISWYNRYLKSRWKWN